MPVWQVALTLNLALALGLGLGYAGWGRHAAAADRQLDVARAELERLERERAACAPATRAGEQQWEGRGIVRAIYPKLLVITHEEIRGLLPARTTSFPTVTAAAGRAIEVGDAVRFSLRGTLAGDAAVVAIAPW